ncbi:4Fe-4S double cluster binding domain-containing protein [Aminipila terrae]|uniref:4Fe-4S dicluster domain-containing protein n=1 Tax=Aminipila terrae TaxID=2697030 RepID=A0A6P1MCX7_9FIRM|nr:4Fe-4S double cluster binding domain-containing protein [Aminipila terrae]QHI71757.1 4Fe-4S dicluster domain-containing protein [Aminipila terrae]
MTDADLSENYALMENMCGKCSKCVDTCPSNAIKMPQILDRPNCLSDFLEDDMPKTDIAKGKKLDGYFFECDICQNICPWNQKHVKYPLNTSYGENFDSTNINHVFELNHLKNMSEEAYEKEIVPFMIGYKLPYKTFKRNINMLL